MCRNVQNVEVSQRRFPVVRKLLSGFDDSDQFCHFCSLFVSFITFFQDGNLTQEAHRVRFLTEKTKLFRTQENEEMSETP